MDLSLTPISTSSLTTKDISVLLSDSLSLLSTLPSIPAPPDSPSPPSPAPNWKHSRTTGQTILYSSTHLKEPWLARITTVPTSISYDTIRRGLFTEKAATERATVLKSADELDVQTTKELEEWHVITVRKLLHIQAFSAREFCQTIIGRDFGAGEKRRFIVISKPNRVDEEKGVRGVYTCVEYVEELEEGGCRISFMVTSDAGGSIPRWMQGMAMPAQIMADSEMFMLWAKKESEK